MNTSELNIPKQFVIACHTIKVELKHGWSDYGEFSALKNTITVALSIEDNGKCVELSKEQIMNSFYHELVHCFQFFYNNGDDESEAQVFANFICEFLTTKK